eukprot:CAMPEP_0197538624 /NCGR_PEP_ID=MMETSP1318-20131121/60161_1 /TAXON_ID=552666 /ORGANISM="Partenskyella glossopodia, Strain RCC365" /LENGTH=837 /DNA_ID=CAMNT_0043097095 /DNA_START=45 /DNA_END=2558 /DNA_ORIENTATION=+
MKIQFLSRAHNRIEEKKDDKKNNNTRHGFPPVREVANRLSSVLPDAIGFNRETLEYMLFEGLQSGNLHDIGLELSECPDLKILRLRNCNIGDARISALADCMLRCPIQQLVLSGCKLTEKSSFLICKILAQHASKRDALQWQKGLRDGFGENAPSAVQRMQTHDSITKEGVVSIDLSSNPLGDEFVRSLCETLRTDKWILAVDLESTDLTLRGIKMIWEMLKDNETLLQLRLGRGWKEPEKAWVKKINELVVTRRRTKFAEFTMSKLETGASESRPWWHKLIKKSRGKRVKSKPVSGAQSQGSGSSSRRLSRSTSNLGSGNSTRIGSSTSSAQHSRDSSPIRGRKNASIDSNVGLGALNLSYISAFSTEELVRDVVVVESQRSSGRKKQILPPSRSKPLSTPANPKKIKATVNKAELPTEKKPKKRSSTGRIPQKNPRPTALELNRSASTLNSGNGSGSPMRNGILAVIGDLDTTLDTTANTVGDSIREEKPVSASGAKSVEAMLDELFSIYKEINLESLIKENERMEKLIQELKSHSASTGKTPSNGKKKLKKAKNGKNGKNGKTTDGKTKKRKLTVKIPAAAQKAKAKSSEMKRKPAVSSIASRLSKIKSTIAKKGKNGKAVATRKKNSAKISKVRTGAGTAKKRVSSSSAPKKRRAGEKKASSSAEKRSSEEAEASAKEESESSPNKDLEVWKELVELGPNLPSTTDIYIPLNGDKVPESKHQASKESTATKDAEQALSLVEKIPLPSTIGGISEMNACRLEVLVSYLETAFSQLHKCVDTIERRLAARGHAASCGVKAPPSTTIAIGSKTMVLEKKNRATPGLANATNKVANA